MLNIAVLVVVSSLINIWYGSYLGPRRLLCTQGKLINWQEENPCWYRGWKNPISHLSRIKNPCFAMSVCSGGPTGLRLHPVLLKCLNSLKTTASFTRTYSPYNWLIAVLLFVFYILAIPYMLSLSYLTIAIYAMPPPLRPIEGVRGIYL